MLGETGVADRTAWGDLAGCARNVAGLAQAELHPVTEQQIDDRDDAQRLEQSAEPRHPPRRRDEELELERGAVKDPALHDKPGATELAAPETGRATKTPARRNGGHKSGGVLLWSPPMGAPRRPKSRITRCRR